MKTQRHVFNPAPETRLEAGDVLIACATNDEVETARQISGS